MTRSVVVIPHDLNWQHDFLAESRNLKIALGDNLLNIYHIGSTSIPTIYAKPIIDILGAVKDLAKVDDLNNEIAALGYINMGEFGIAGRRFLRKDNAAGIRTHHVHIFELGSPQIDRHLAFRDYLRVHLEDAQKYSELKQQLARQYSADIERYMDGKDEFIRAIDRKAAEWKAQLTKTGTVT